MSATYSEVLSMANKLTADTPRFDNEDERQLCVGMLRSYAERIEADERAVPVGHFCEMSSGQWEQTRHEFAGLLGVTPLFTHPPAQAAQVDGLVSRNPAPNAAAPMMPSPDVTLHVGAHTHPHSPDAADSGRVDETRVADALRVFHQAYAVARMGSPRRAGATFAAVRAVLQFALAPPASPAGVPDGYEAAVAAIQFALHGEDGLTFLRYWNEGEFDVCREEWPEAPADCYVGADPLLAAAPSATPEGGEVGL